jgi:hypothetical protein
MASDLPLAPRPKRTEKQSGRREQVQIGHGSRPQTGGRHAHERRVGKPLEKGAEQRRKFEVWRREDAHHLQKVNHVAHGHEGSHDFDVVTAMQKRTEMQKHKQLRK